MSAKLRISCLPPGDWPEADRLALDTALDSDDPLDSDAVLGHLSGQRKTVVRKAYGRWLGFLPTRRPETAPESGLDHLTKDNISAFIATLQADLAPYSVACYVTALFTAVRAMKPGLEIQHLGNAVRYLWRIARPQKDKRHRLRPTHELYELGFDLMRQASLINCPISAAGMYRDGLMIALLAARPVRLANLASIELGRHLELKIEDYWLVFPAVEVKTRRHLEFPLPRDLVQPLDFYLYRHRPVLMERNGRWNTGPHDGLWVSAHGSKMSAHRIEVRIGMRTLERFGQTICPHLFRDAAATSVAIEDPEHVGIVAAILGHSTFRTVEQYYNQANSLEAARRFQSAIVSFRNASGGTI